MAVETDVSELRKRQKEKARKSFLIKLSAVVVVTALVLVGVFTKDKWYPYLDGILNKIPGKSLLSESSDAELAEGQFPISVTGGSDYQIMAMDNHFALIDDSHFMIYDTAGNPVAEKQHTYSNPILTASDKKALIYDLGGKSFSLESKYKTVYEKNCEQTILKAEISRNDYVAVVTKSDKYLAQLDVYNADGGNIFTYKSYDSRIVDVTFTDDSSGCYITTLGASGGQIVSGLISFSFSSTKMLWQSETIPALAVSSGIDENGNIVLICDDRIACFDDRGNLLNVTEYGDDILDYGFSKKMSVVLTENSALRKYSLLIAESGSTGEFVTAELPEAAKKILVYDKMVYVLTGSGIYTYNNLGQEISGVRLTDSYVDFCKLGGYMFLMGYDEINRIDFNG